MDLGSQYIPDKRFSQALIDLKLIHDRRRMEETRSSDLSALFGYKHPTATPFYHRLNSLIAFGLVEGRGNYKITELGQKILFPENEQEDKSNKTKAVLTVPLWKELYHRYKKSLPTDKLRVDLKNIIGLEPDKAQEVEEQIKKWYNEDIVYVSDLVDNTANMETLRSGMTNIQSMPQQLVQSKPIQNDPSTHELIRFGEISLSLPKKDLRKQWGKLQKYMEIYLEDYQYDEAKNGDDTKTDWL